jgi:hypothetical protein
VRPQNGSGHGLGSNGSDLTRADFFKTLVYIN